MNPPTKSEAKPAPNPEFQPTKPVNKHADLRIKRHFTKEGVHPYDEVNWELRTAKVGSGDKVVFEQHGVEVPEFWSQNATNIVAQKYFAYNLDDPRRETSVKQLIDRVALTIAAEGEKNGYFNSAEREVFEAELTYVLLHQKAAFNSPVWFNVGVMERPACSACFILHIEDSLKSIGRWQMEETEIFRNGSGAGINLSSLRGSQEQLSRGGVSSGPVTFMRAADANAGTIASGGRTRRAAKLICLDADHPDIFDFIWCKAREEDRIRALSAAGFDMSLGSEVGEKNLAEATAYQNANNSVRVTQELLDAAERDEDWHLIRRTDGEVAQTVKAREILEAIAEASWKCADPGVQYDTTINDWHTTPELGKINGSNPCFPAGEKVLTPNGLVAIEELHDAFKRGESVKIATYDFVSDECIGKELPSKEIGDLGLSESTAIAFEGVEIKPIVKLSFQYEVVTAQNLSDGGITKRVESVRCTPDHRFWTRNRGWVPANELTDADDPRILTSGTGLLAWHGAKLVSRVEDGEERVYNLTEPKNHSYVVNGFVVSNCSEYMHVDNSSCNLASLNLLTFLNPDGTYNVEDFKHVTRLIFTAQDITICFAHFPTRKIGENSRNLRQIGIGYANLGALLMNLGYAYDSDEGRQVAGAITALLTGESYLQSTHIAERVGAYYHYPETAESMQRVLKKHTAEARKLEGVFGDVADEAKRSWRATVSRCKDYGIRNSQASVLAPTGTIAFLMGCDTTGIEPDFALIKHKTLAGGGTMSIPNNAVGPALRNLGYEADQIEEILAYITEEIDGFPRGNVVGAPHLNEEHYSVFDCAVGERSISPEGHLKMIAAAQPFLSGAVSKTINTPNDTTIEEIADIYQLGGKLGLKAVAIYRDGSKNFQPLSDANKKQDRTEEAEKAVQERLTSILGDGMLRGERRELSRDADVRRVKFRVGMISGYIHVGLFDDGRPGDIFITVGQAGSTLRGFIDAFGVLFSLALQHGTPLDIIISKLANMQFEPYGFTDDQYIRNAKSIVDYVVKWMAMEFLPDELVYSELGITKPIPGVTVSTTTVVGAGSGKADATALETSSEATSGDDTGSDGEDGAEIRPRIEIHSATVPAARKPSVKVTSDVKVCGSCGSQMVRTGVCYTCPSCGENSGGCS